MAIALTKTLQAVEYDFHIVSMVQWLSATLVVLQAEAYQSEGHYNDGFVPMIVRRETINHAPTAASFGGVYSSSVGMATAEAWLIANVAWYSGGSVV